MSLPLVPRDVQWTMLRDNPRQAVMFWKAGAGCWLAYFVMGRRRRSAA